MKCLEATEPETEDRKRYSSIPFLITFESRLAAFSKFGKKEKRACYVTFQRISSTKSVSVHNMVLS